MLLAGGTLAIAEEAEAEEAKTEETEAEEKKEKSPPAPVLQEKPPIYAPPQLKPLKPLTPARLLVSEKKDGASKEAEKKPADERAKHRPLRQRPGARRREAAYQLDNIGPNVHLSPAMRWHLRRTGIATDPLPGTSPQSARVAGSSQGQNYYPGVSRLPEQKPFEGLQPPPSAFDRYWPLLLEGQQNPETGYIIWRLP